MSTVAMNREDALARLDAVIGAGDELLARPDLQHKYPGIGTQPAPGQKARRCASFENILRKSARPY